MKRVLAGLVVVLMALGAGCATKGKTAASGGKEWAIKADLAGACCCAVPCPCAFQQKPTLGHCEANLLIDVESGHYKGVRLDGLQFVISWRGGSWVKYYLSEKATDEQIAAIQKLMPEAVAIFRNTNVLAAERAPITVRRSGGKITFSVPASKVEIEMLRGKDGGPVVMRNLNHPLTEMRVQYLASSLSHTDPQNGFSHSDTNGMTSVLDKASAR